MSSQERDTRTTFEPTTITTIFCPPSKQWKNLLNDRDVDMRKVKLTPQNGEITMKQIEKKIYDKWSTHFNKMSTPIKFKMLNSQNNQQLITVSDGDDWDEFFKQNETNQGVYLYLFQYPTISNPNITKPKSQQYQDENEGQHQDLQPDTPLNLQPVQHQATSPKLQRMQIYIHIYIYIYIYNIHIRIT